MLSYLLVIIRILKKLEKILNAYKKVDCFGNQVAIRTFTQVFLDKKITAKTPNFFEFFIRFLKSSFLILTIFFRSSRNIRCNFHSSRPVFF